MSCQQCGSKRLAEILGKCSDLCHFSTQGKEGRGYVPYDVEMGGGDYIEFTYCLNCGQIQGQFPISEDSVARVFEE